MIASQGAGQQNLMQRTGTEVGATGTLVDMAAMLGMEVAATGIEMSSNFAIAVENSPDILT
jgi:hypothetical protein